MESLVQAQMKHHVAPYVSTIVSAALVMAGIFAVYTLIRDAKKDHMELVAALSKNNQEVILLKTIDDRVKAPMETKVAMSRTIINLANLKRIPVELICGIIEIESGKGWKTDLISSAGAVGLMQVMPATGKPYLRVERIDPTKQALLDPINNLICGISAFADYRDQAQDFGLDKPGDFGVALAMYNQGPRASKASNYSRAVLEAMKRYKALGL
jgi:Transglycosylase SLT domain